MTTVFYDNGTGTIINNPQKVTYTTPPESCIGTVKKNSGRYPWGDSKKQIKNVIFNDPATIVFWEDGSKTVVKCSPDDKFDKEIGLAMAILKHLHNDRSDYFNKYRKWCKGDE